MMNLDGEPVPAMKQPDLIKDDDAVASEEENRIFPLGYWMWRKAKQLIIFVVGMTILIIGIIMIVAPGPAFIVIPLGLAILGTEFLWARRLLAYAKQKVREVTGTSTPQDHDSDQLPHIEADRRLIEHSAVDQVPASEVRPAGQFTKSRANDDASGERREEV